MLYSIVQQIFEWSQQRIIERIVIFSKTIEVFRKFLISYYGSWHCISLCILTALRYLNSKYLEWQKKRIHYIKTHRCIEKIDHGDDFTLLKTISWKCLTTIILFIVRFVLMSGSFRNLLSISTVWNNYKIIYNVHFFL